MIPLSILPTNPGELIGLVGAVSLPLSGVIVAIIAKIRSDKPADPPAKPVAHDTMSAAEISVRKTLAATSEKEAHNAEISIIIEGFTASMEALRLTVADARLESSEAKMEATSARADVTKLRQTMDAMAEQREELIDHIQALEALIPSPPGPPPRPAWSHKTQ